jgi:hypothetical protein
MTTNLLESVEVVVQHTSGQFSDSPAAHRHDARTLFEHARDVGAWAATGTEAGDAAHNHDLHDALHNAAHAVDFYFYGSHAGEWVAVNRKFLRFIDHGFDGPFIPGTHGLSPAQGGHGPRGIAWVTACARDDVDLGNLTFGSCHFLTARSIAETGHTNAPLVAGAGAFGRKFGRGSDLVVLDGDANLDDLRVDVFDGEPFTTLADELGRHPATHGRDVDHGRPIDFLASYDPDGRVSGRRYVVLDDHRLALAGDHFLLLGRYDVKPRRP